MRERPQPVAFCIGSSKADDMAAFQFANLADQAANSTCSSGHNKSLARLRLADLEKAKVGSVARHAEGSQGEAGGEGANVRGDHRHPGHLGRVGHPMLHPTGIDDYSAPRWELCVS